MKKALIVALALIPLFALGQTTGEDHKANASQPIIVSLTSKTTDVRAIISDLFSQAKQNYVLQPGIQAAIYLSLDKVEFDEALAIVCNQAHLQYEIQNGIYFITKKVVVAPATPPPAKGVLDKGVLSHRLTTKLTKTDIRLVFAEFAKQTEVKIEVDKSVPNYKLDALLNHTSLKFALDKVTEATGLKYKFTDNLSILIYKPDDGNKIAVTGGQ
ncbi:MAG TPA: hypothetical protein VHE55_06500 [Fimbriimonadaceae bacterium]|nr:hypothetical protein [Fimbriimonadaceae bacterium]